jgi:bisphosphoglycerate-dependent phosphoglycerate mutase
MLTDALKGTCVIIAVLLCTTVHAQTTATCKKEAQEALKNGFIISTYDLQKFFIAHTSLMGSTKNISGKMDTETQLALKQYQKQNGIAQSGTIDADTKRVLFEAYCGIEATETKKVIDSLPPSLRTEKKLDAYILLPKEMPRGFTLSTKRAAQRKANPSPVAPSERLRIFKEYTLPSAGAMAPYMIIYTSTDRRTSVTMTAIEYTSLTYASAAGKSIAQNKKLYDSFNIAALKKDNTIVLYGVDGTSDERTRVLPAIEKALKEKLKI